MKKYLLIAICSLLIGVTSIIIYFNQQFGNSSDPRFLVYSVDRRFIPPLIKVVPIGLENTIIDSTVQMNDKFSVHRVTDLRYGVPSVFYYANIDNEILEIRNPIFRNKNQTDSYEYDDLIWLVHLDNFNRLMTTCCNHYSIDDIIKEYVSLLVGTEEKVVQILTFEDIDSMIALNIDRYDIRFETIGIMEKFSNYRNLGSGYTFWSRNYGLLYIEWSFDDGQLSVTTAKVIGQLGIEQINL